jgi:CheY-like chemotaxis protein
VPTSPACVLIVDDDSDARQIYGLALEHAGFAILTANNGFEAIRLAKLHEPDVILMDIAMPEVDGVTALQSIRTSPLTRAIPIIAVTAIAVSEELPATVVGGFDEIMLKPVPPMQVVEAVRRWVATADFRRDIGLLGRDPSRPRFAI